MIAQKYDTVASLVDPVREAIEYYAGQMERDRQMPRELHDRLKAGGLFGLYIPREYGGLGYSLPKALRVVSEVARVDGSAGWTVALTFAAAYFGGLIPPESAAEILRGGNTFVAGSAQPLKAVRVEGGYRVFGQARYVSGIAHADWLSLVGMLHEGEAPVMGPAGPETIGVFIPRSEVEMVDTWHAIGLAGSGTHDARLSGQFVPEERVAHGNPFSTGFELHRHDTLQRLPFMSMLATVQSGPVCLGVARHAIDAFTKLATGKVNPMTGQALRERPVVQATLARAEASVRAAEALFFGSVKEMWAKVDGGGEFTNDDRASIRMAATFVAETTSGAVDSLFRAAGTTAIMTSLPLERCWRDVHAAASHVQVQDANWEAAGRVLFGMEPAAMMF